MNFQHAVAVTTSLLLLASTAVGFQAPILLVATPAHDVLGRGRQSSFFSSSTTSSHSGTGLTRRAATTKTSAATPSSVTVEHLENSAVLVHIPVPGKATQAAYDKVCRELSKDIQIPGFRKGSRLPPQVLENSMASKPGGRNALKIQAIKELVGQLVEPTMKEQALDPIGQLTLKVSPEDLAETFVPGEELMLDVQCDVWPEIRWKSTPSSDDDANSDTKKPYVGLTATYKRKSFNQAKLDKATMDLQERYATLEPIADQSHALQMGDACTVNMVGYMADASGQKGDPLPNAASGDRVQVLMGTGRYMEGLVEGLVGAKPGDSVTVSVNFPAKLRDKTLAGKCAIFDVEVLDASKRIVPEVTDDFAAKVRPGLTRESLLQELRKAVDQEDAKEFTPARNQALGKALAQVLEVVVPDTLVTNQAREKFATMMADMRDGGVSDEEIKKQINPENFSKYKDIVKNDIIADFKVSMATDEIARLEGITVPAYQVDEQMEAIRKDAAESKEEFDEALIRGKVETTLTRQAVYDWLAERANLTVEYLEQEPVFDEKLMEKLAEESLQREKQGMPAVVEEATKVIDAVVVESSSTKSKIEETLETATKPEPTAVARKEEAPVVGEETVQEPQSEELAPVVEALAEAQPEEPTPAEPAPVAKIETEPAPTTTAIAAAKAIDEASMTMEERAFSALLNAGLITINKSPDDPDYDHSKDSEVADGTIFKE